MKRAISTYTLRVVTLLIIFSYWSEAIADKKPIPFQGLYIGFNTGYTNAHGRVIHKRKVSPCYGSSTRKFDLSVKGAEYGLHLGYTYRYENIGIGLEGVYNIADVNGHHQTKFFGLITAFEKASLKRNVQVRANLSYIICDRVAPKLIVGWNRAKWRRTITSPSLGINISQTYNDEKPIYGIGVDFLLVDHLVGGIEYTKITGSEKKIYLNRTNETSFKPKYNRFAFVLKYVY